MRNECDDYETFIKKTQSNQKQNSHKCKDDFLSMFSDLFGSINYKTAIFLFILGILIFSDVFIELVLTSTDGAVYGDAPTTKGTIIQLLALTFGYIIIDLLAQGKII